MATTGGLGMLKPVSPHHLVDNDEPHAVIHDATIGSVAVDYVADGRATI